MPFYAETLSLAVHEHGKERAVLGSSDRAYLYLIERPDATDAPQEAGLFHTAFLYRDRAQLADALVSLAEQGGTLEGVADHGVSNALYLRDPDGNGVELYYDLPRDRWPRAPDGSITMYTEPLDLNKLADQRTAGAGHRAAAELGHVHLRVSSVAASDRFYVGGLGFDPVVRFSGSASFVSVAGYHHHLGYNVWQRSRPRTAGGLYSGLARLSLYAADAAKTTELTDPDGIPVELLPAP